MVVNLPGLCVIHLVSFTLWPLIRHCVVSTSKPVYCVAYRVYVRQRGSTYIRRRESFFFACFLTSICHCRLFCQWRASSAFVYRCVHTIMTVPYSKQYQFLLSAFE
jgi:hypothetical protein